MKTYSVQVQSLNERDGYLIDAECLLDAMEEAIDSFHRTHSEPASSIQAESTSVGITDQVG